MENPQDTQEPTSQTQIQTKTVQIKTDGDVGAAWSFVKNGNFQVIVTLVGVASVLFNLYLGSKLAPVAQDIREVANIAKANDARLDTLGGTATTYLPQYIATQQQVINMSSSVQRIEASQIRLEQKFDTYLLNSK